MISFSLLVNFFIVTTVCFKFLEIKLRVVINI